MDQDPQRSRWPLTITQLLWASGIAAVVFLIIVIFGYLLSWRWTGFGASTVPDHVQPAKTLWDWLDLLFIPVVLAVGGYLFNSAQNRATQAAAERRAETDRELADQSAQDEALQAYLNQIGQLLLAETRPLRQNDEVRTWARAWTLTVLPGLDGDRKARVVQFLYEADLISREQPVLDLSGADLRGIDLSRAGLPGAYLRGVSLSQAYLRGVSLLGSDLLGSDLRGADLGEAGLEGADLGVAALSEANLGRAYLRRTDLRETDLSRASLIETDLSGTNLRGADLRETDLSGAIGWTEEQLRAPRSLEGATMPNGQKYEEWLKYKEDNEEDGENHRP